MKMAKWISPIIICFLIFNVAYAQGIDFEKGPWAKVVEKAKKEDKLIYLDAYAVWCGPCKMMDKNVFPKKEVAAVYNKLFINYSVDAEKGEGKEIARKYKVTAYPTHLFIDPKTEEIAYMVKGGMDAENFILLGETAEREFRDTLTIEKMEEMYLAGEVNEEFLVQYIQKLNNQYRDATKVLDKFTLLYGKEMHPEKWNFMLRNTKDISSETAAFILKNASTLQKHWTVQEQMQFVEWKNQLLNTSLLHAIGNQDKNHVKAIYQTIKSNEGFIPLFNDEYTLWEIYYQHVNQPEEKEKFIADALNNLLLKEEKDFENHIEESKKNILSFLELQIKNAQPDISSEDLEKNKEGVLSNYQIPDEKEKAKESLLNGIETLVQEDRLDYVSNALLWNRKALEWNDLDEDYLRIEKQYIALLILNKNKKKAEKELKHLKKEHELKWDENDKWDAIILKNI